MADSQTSRAERQTTANELDARVLAAVLADRAVFPLRIEHHPQIDSTQNRASVLARADGQWDLPVLVVADKQTSGRGRGGNAWWSGPGSLTFSLAFEPAMWGLSPTVQPQRALAAGVALVDALAQTLPNSGLGLHWPNDVFAGGRKLAGILLDVLPGGRHVLGIGINVNNSFDAAPVDVQRRAVAACQLAAGALDRTALLVAVLNQLARTMQELAASPDEFGRRFDSLCLQKGARLTIAVGAAQTSGLCTGIGTDGALLLETASGARRFYCGTLIHDSPIA